MLVKINGNIEDIKTQSSLAELVLLKGLQAQRLVIEHNLQIVLRENWDSTSLKENDTVEIVTFMGGGSKEGNLSWKIF